MRVLMWLLLEGAVISVTSNSYFPVEENKKKRKYNIHDEDRKKPKTDTESDMMSNDEYQQYWEDTFGQGTDQAMEPSDVTPSDSESRNTGMSDMMNNVVSSEEQDRHHMDFMKNYITAAQFNDFVARESVMRSFQMTESMYASGIVPIDNAEWERVRRYIDASMEVKFLNVTCHRIVYPWGIQTMSAYAYPKAVQNPVNLVENQELAKMIKLFENLFLGYTDKSMEFTDQLRLSSYLKYLFSLYRADRELFDKQIYSEGHMLSLWYNIEGNFFILVTPKVGEYYRPPVLGVKKIFVDSYGNIGVRKQDQFDREFFCATCNCYHPM